jgi:hypothetical protein
MWKNRNLVGQMQQLGGLLIPQLEKMGVGHGTSV